MKMLLHSVIFFIPQELNISTLIYLTVTVYLTRKI